MAEDENGLWIYTTGWAIPDSNAAYRIQFEVTDPGGTFHTEGPRIVVNNALLDVLEDWVNDGRLDLLLDAVKERTDNLPDDPADDSDIDAQLSAIAGYIDTEITAIQAAIAALNNISVADIISGIADGSYDLQKMMRIIFAVIAGKSAGGATALISFRDSGDTKDRVQATVDTDGNRTAKVLDGS